MANMSYCRFENTARDLQDCLYALSESDCDDGLGTSEVRGLIEILDLANEIVGMEDKINNIIENNE